MMLDPETFAKHILLDADADALKAVIAEERNNLWPTMAQIWAPLTVIGESLYTLDTSVVEVVGAAYDMHLIYQIDERKLDALNPAWRLAANDTPRHYLWRGEQPSGVLRLHPPPDSAKRLHVVTLDRPLVGQIRWHNLYLALATIRTLSVADPLRARPQLAAFAEALLKDIHA